MIDCPKCHQPTKVIHTCEEKRTRVCVRGHKFETTETFKRWVPTKAQYLASRRKT